MAFRETSALFCISNKMLELDLEKTLRFPQTNAAHQQLLFDAIFLKSVIVFLL